MFKVYFLFLMLTLIVVSITWKLEKTLLLVVSMEMISLILMAMIIITGGIHSYILLTFSFFISEALITMSTIYFMLRVFGSYTSTILLS